MKIAVCLFGHLRTYEQCFLGLKQHLLDKYDCDVFIHTWNTIDHSDNEEPQKQILPIKGNLTSDLKNKIIDLYNPKGITVEKQDETRYDKLGFYTLQQHWGTFKKSISNINYLVQTFTGVNSLREEYQKENNIKYDFVIFIRPDILLKNDFKIESFTEDMTAEELDKSFFFVSSCYPYTRLNDVRKMGGTDLLYFARPDIITDVFNNIDKFLNNFSTNTLLIRRCPESYFIETIKNLNYLLWQINYRGGTDYQIIRNQEKEKKQETHYEKHCKKLKNSLKSIFDIHRELISVIYYFTIKK